MTGETTRIDRPRIYDTRPGRVAAALLAATLAIGTSGCTTIDHKKAANKPTASAKPSAKPSAHVPIIVLDPGHSAKTDLGNIDKATGFKDPIFPNHPEIEEVQNITNIVAKKLITDGYKVFTTKGSATDSASNRQRVDIADQAHADLVVSIHDDHTRKQDFQGVFAQFVGGWRGEKSTRMTYTNAANAAESQRVSCIIAKARTVAQGHPVSCTDRLDFTTRPILEPGNLPLVQLWSDKVWVYNETGGKHLDQQAYAQGLIAGIEQAEPIG